jgi:hypothetical protein
VAKEAIFYLDEFGMKKYVSGGKFCPRAYTAFNSIPRPFGFAINMATHPVSFADTPLDRGD